jgi:hypothetical protein
MAQKMTLEEFSPFVSAVEFFGYFVQAQNVECQNVEIQVVPISHQQVGSLFNIP